MIFLRIYNLIKTLPCAFIFFTLGGCYGNHLRPIISVNRIISNPEVNYTYMDLKSNWLALIANRNDKDRIELINLRNRRFVYLPGLNKDEFQPLRLSISSDANVLAIIRRTRNINEVLIYRRKFKSSQLVKLPLNTTPINLSLDGNGRFLAVEVSRDGRLEIDLIRL